MKRGFTLIEIIISIAILSIGLILILQGFTNSLNSLRISENNLEATLIAEDIMSQMQIIAKESQGGILRELNGKSELSGIEFVWDTKLTELTEYEDLIEALITISWKEGRRKGAVGVLTYLRIPVETE